MVILFSPQRTPQETILTTNRQWPIKQLNYTSIRPSMSHNLIACFQNPNIHHIHGRYRLVIVAQAYLFMIAFAVSDGLHNICVADLHIIPLQ
jgi:hypothetical protein